MTDVAQSSQHEHDQLENAAPPSENEGTTSHDIPLPAAPAPRRSPRTGTPRRRCRTRPAGRRRRTAAAAPRRAVRALPRPAGRRPGRRAEGARQRHRLPVPRGERVHLADRRDGRPTRCWCMAAEAADAATTATLYVREYAQPGEVAYFTSRVHGAVWVGNVPSRRRHRRRCSGIATRPLDAARRRPAAAPRAPTPRCCAASTRRSTRCCPAVEHRRSAQVLDELRLVKDDWEIGRLRYACDATARGFADVVRELPNGASAAPTSAASAGSRARSGGGPGSRATRSATPRSSAPAGTRTTLHWWRNNGVVEPGQLLLADMGVETDELYTADVTRTMPVDGEWTPAQLQGLPRRARGAGRRHRRGEGRRRLPRRAPRRDVGARRPPALAGASCR